MRMKLSLREEVVELPLEKIELPEKKLIPNLKPGFSYLIEESKPQKIFKIFQSYVENGFSGLCFTRCNPKKVGKRYNLNGSKVFWLTTIKRKDFVDPSNLSKISYILNDFIRKTENPIVLLEGVEYLMVQNNFEDILKFFYFINDNIALKKAILLISLNPNTLPKRNLVLLEQEFQVIT